MTFFQKDPAKAAAKADARATAKAEQERLRAEEAFRRSPVGRARGAREAGLRFFQISIPLQQTERTALGVLSGDSTQAGMKTSKTDAADTLAAIENEGWRLEQAGYVFRQTGAVSRDKLLSSGQTETVMGEVLGVYIFRAAGA